MKDQVYSNTRVPTQVSTSPTRINASQHESDTSQHESDTNQHESTRINTRQYGTDTSQHESKTGLDHEKEKNMTKRKKKTQFKGGVEDCIYQDSGFFLKFMNN